jgi:hypothetical protein
MEHFLHAAVHPCRIASAVAAASGRYRRMHVVSWSIEDKERTDPRSVPGLTFRFSSQQSRGYFPRWLSSCSRCSIIFPSGLGIEMTTITGDM